MPTLPTIRTDLTVLPIAAATVKSVVCAPSPLSRSRNGKRVANRTAMAGRADRFRQETNLGHRP